MKNTGFLVGAYLSGKLSSGMLSKAMKVQDARNIFKNTALAAGMGEKTPGEVMAMYNQGKAIGSQAKVSEALAEAAKNAKWADTKLKLASAAIGSFGESRMEAITNSNDWFEKNKQQLDNMKSDDIKGLDEQIYNDHPEYFTQEPIVDRYGQVVGYRPVLANQEAFNSEYNRRLQEIEDKYDGALAEASRQRANYANASFGINFLLTYGENV